MVTEAEDDGTQMEQRDRFPELASFLTAIFEGLTEKEFEELRGSILCTQYHRDDLIFQEGSFFSGLYIVYTGLVKIGKRAPTSADKRRVFHFLPPKELIGLEALFMPERQTNSQFARALMDSELIFIEKNALLNFLERHPQVLFDLCHRLAREVVTLEFKLTRDATQGSIQNFSLLLLALNSKYGMRVKSGSQIELKLPRDTLAAMLGASKETLSRVMKRLEDENIISEEKHKITVMNKKRLEQLAKIADHHLDILEQAF
ncbi:MAG: Crp/Fnr family transcriptional regulator [Candidatus Bipolaricaulia bacterium]